MTCDQGALLSHGGTAGREGEVARAVDRCARERARVAGKREATAHAGRQIGVEGEDPGAGVGPARRALRGRRALDRERVGGAARIAERNHRRGEARADLANLLGGSLRREGVDARGVRERRERDQGGDCRAVK